MRCLEPLEGRRLFASYAAANVTELIAAMNAANASAVADEITLAPGATFTLTAVNHSVYSPTGLPFITAAGGGLTIFGNGSTIQRSGAAGTPAFRLFHLDINTSLTLSDLTVRGGAATGVSFGTQSGPGVGGGIYNDGFLNLSNVVVEGNTATGASPQPGEGSQTGAGDALGGGIYCGFSSTLTMTNCVVRNNLAVGGRGHSGGLDQLGHFWPALAGCDGFGGGIFIDNGLGIASIRNSTITSNTAQGGLGGIPSRKKYTSSGKGIGGGIYIETAASRVSLDVFTVRNTSGNFADSSREIFGSYTKIV